MSPERHRFSTRQKGMLSSFWLITRSIKLRKFWVLIFLPPSKSEGLGITVYRYVIRKEGVPLSTIPCLALAQWTTRGRAAQQDSDPCWLSARLWSYNTTRALFMVFQTLLEPWLQPATQSNTKQHREVQVAPNGIFSPESKANASP